MRNQDIWFDSLPYIDKQPTELEIIQAKELISKELDSINTAELHVDIPKNPKSYLSNDTDHVIQRIGLEGYRLNSIDIGRYSELYDENGQLNVDKALISLQYSLYRQENLALLSQFGKNQWLISNDILAQSLAKVESELLETKKSQDIINQNRKRKQLENESKLAYLESRWENGIKNLVDANVASLKISQQIKKQRFE